MKKILTILTIYLLSSGVSFANDCSGFKKTSKEYLSCQSINLKNNVVTTGVKIKNGTISIFNSIKKKVKS